MKDPFNKYADDLMAKAMLNMSTATCATADHSEPLTLKTLEKLSEFAKPLPKLFVVAQKHLPDDCYGILYVRPEEAERWKNER